MSPASLDAVVFAADHRSVAAFYLHVLRASLVGQDDHHTALDVQGFMLVIQQIPSALAPDISESAPVPRREEGAIRLNFVVPNIAECRNLARQFGGDIDLNPPPWAGDVAGFYLGCDPEGNVVGFQTRLNIVASH